MRRVEGGDGRLVVWLRGEWPLVLLGLVCVASLPFLVHPYYDVVGDGSIYIATARSLVEGEGYAYLEAPYRVRPPGLSLLLAPVLAVFGNDPLALNLLIAAFGVLAVMLVFAHERGRQGDAVALMLALVIFFNPGFRKYSTQVLSDVPGLAALFALLLAARWADRRPALARDALLGACIGLAAYLRTALVLVLPAILLARWLRSGAWSWTAAWAAGLGWRRALPMALVCLAVMAPWALRNHLVAPPGPVDQLVIYDYSTAQWRARANDPDSPRLPLSEVLARAGPRSYEIVKSLGSRMGWGSASEGPQKRAFAAAEVALTALLLLGLGWATIARRDAGSLFAWLSLGVLLIYFDFHARLALPVYVLALLGSVDGLRALSERFLGEARGRAAVCAALALLGAVDFDPARGRDVVAGKHLDLEERCVALRRAIPPATRLATTIGWDYSMCLERPVFLIAQRVMMEGDAAAAEQVIDRHEVDAVFLDRTSAYDRRFAPYFRAVYGEPRRVGVLDVWRVRPRAARPDQP